MAFIVLTNRETKIPVAINTDDISTVTALSLSEQSGVFAVDELVITLRSDPARTTSYYLPQKLQRLELTDPTEALGRFAHWVETLA
jgi:hypothetical protein